MKRWERYGQDNALRLRRRRGRRSGSINVGGGDGRGRIGRRRDRRIGTRRSWGSGRSGGGRDRSWERIRESARWKNLRARRALPFVGAGGGTRSKQDDYANDNNRPVTVELLYGSCRETCVVLDHFQSFAFTVAPLLYMASVSTEVQRLLNRACSRQG